MIGGKDQKMEVLQRAGLDQGQVQGELAEPAQAVGGHRFAQQQLLEAREGTSVDGWY